MTIFPFHDEPDKGIEVVWYPVPRDRERVPPTIFRPHWWEIKDNYERKGAGTPEHEAWRIWQGPYPETEVLPLLGTLEQWEKGVSYAEYIAGTLPGADRCLALPVPGLQAYAGRSSFFIPQPLRHRGYSGGSLHSFWAPATLQAGRSAWTPLSAFTSHHLLTASGKSRFDGYTGVGYNSVGVFRNKSRWGYSQLVLINIFRGKSRWWPDSDLPGEQHFSGASRFGPGLSPAPPPAGDFVHHGASRFPL